MEVGDPKTCAGTRTIVLPSSTAELLRLRKQTSYSPWIFHNPLRPEAPMNPTAAYRQLKAILSEHGLPDIRFHDLRHTFATHALANGVDAKTLSCILGHTKASFTVDTYQKWWELQCQVNEFYSGKKQQRPPLSKQKEFRAIRNAVIREAENIRLGKITFEDEKMEERGEWVDNWEVSYECLRLRAKIEDNKLQLAQRDEAVEDLERLAEHGDVHAQYFLGLLYRDGSLLLPDAKQAAHWLELAAKRNLPAAQYALGKLYLSDDPEVHDVDDGLRWLESAARNGNTDAAYRLGKEYLTGKSVQKDAVKAAEYLRYSADQNHPWASYLLGKLYLTSNGAPKDEEAAWNCFRMADAYGHPNAQYILERQDQWHQPQLLFTVSRLLYHMSNIFRDNAPTVPTQPRLHIDRKRMRELQELRIALGHQPDDHEEEQTQTQTWGGMTMKG